MPIASIEEIAAAIASLSDADRQRLYAELERLGVSRRTSPDQDRAGSEGVSAHDRARHLIGPGSSLGDLSTNPAYMEGFGESDRA